MKFATTIIAALACATCFALAKDAAALPVYRDGDDSDDGGRGGGRRTRVIVEEVTITRGGRGPPRPIRTPAPTITAVGPVDFDAPGTTRKFGQKITLVYTSDLPGFSTVTEDVRPTTTTLTATAVYTAPGNKPVTVTATQTFISTDTTIIRRPVIYLPTWYRFRSRRAYIRVYRDWCSQLTRWLVRRQKALFERVLVRILRIRADLTALRLALVQAEARLAGARQAQATFNHNVQVHANAAAAAHASVHTQEVAWHHAAAFLNSIGHYRPQSAVARVHLANVVNALNAARNHRALVLSNQANHNAHAGAINGEVNAAAAEVTRIKALITQLEGEVVTVEKEVLRVVVAEWTHFFIKETIAIGGGSGDDDDDDGDDDRRGRGGRGHGGGRNDDDDDDRRPRRHRGHREDDD
ncbi:hypothetical protein HGRIS_007262 [Hohenbuehelia grisea]|uniref:Uncharacterized protein n=1 Tax=Hohenbuehelia grisea TaxID=104357 RepID=A0ABR3JBX4_9AGAR